MRKELIHVVVAIYLRFSINLTKSNFKKNIHVEFWFILGCSVYNAMLKTVWWRSIFFDKHLQLKDSTVFVAKVSSNIWLVKEDFIK